MKNLLRKLHITKNFVLILFYKKLRSSYILFSFYLVDRNLFYWSWSMNDTFFKNAELKIILETESIFCLKSPFAISHNSFLCWGESIAFLIIELNHWTSRSKFRNSWDNGNEWMEYIHVDPFWKFEQKSSQTVRAFEKNNSQKEK